MDILRPRDEQGKFSPLSSSPLAVSGVYRITNTITGDFYIGSSANIQQRWREHRRKLRDGRSGHTILKRAWDKYGEEAFEFSIQEVTERDKDVLLARENYYIQTLNPKYNCTFIANSHLGMKRSEETRAKLRQRVMSEETKEKLRQANKGKKHSAERIAKRRNRVFDDVTREKYRQDRLKQQLTDEQKAKQRAAMNTPEYREKQRQSHLGVPKSPEHLASWRKSRMGHTVSEETREKLRQANLGKKYGPEVAAKKRETRARKKSLE